MCEKEGRTATGSKVESGESEIPATAIEMNEIVETACCSLLKGK